MNKRILIRIFGFLFLLGGIFMLAVYPGISSPFAIDAGVLLLCGLFLVLFSFSKVIRMRRPSEFDKTVGRRILLFTLLYLIYVSAAFLILYRSDEQGQISQSALIHVGIGYLAVTGAYFILLYQLIRDRKANRIQDKAIGELPSYENSRLFSMVTENAGDNPGIWLSGILHGEVQPGDKAYIIDMGKVVETIIEKTETRDNRSVLSVKTDRRPKGPWTIITSMIPYANTGWETPVTNPELFSLMEGASDRQMNSEYLSHLIYAAAHSRFLVRVSEADKQEKAADRFSTWLFGYHGNYIPETVMLKDENIPTCSCYTDWNAFGKALAVLNEKDREASKALILTFQQLADAAIRTGSPIVINPFGPSPFRISRELLRELINNEGYRKEFSRKK